MKVPLSKSGRAQVLVGSNPTLSANLSGLLCGPGMGHAGSVLLWGRLVDAQGSLSAERCWSGRTGAPGERVGEFSPRGFESHPLRQFPRDAGWWRGLVPMGELLEVGLPFRFRSLGRIAPFLPRLVDT